MPCNVMTRWQIKTDESVKKFDLEQAIHSLDKREREEMRQDRAR